METAFGPGSIKVQDLELYCAILYDGTQVFTLISAQKALGYEGKSNMWMHDFMLHLSRFVPVSVDVLEELSEPDAIAVNQIAIDILPVELFQEVCDVITTASTAGFLYASELKFAKRAKMLTDWIESVSLNSEIESASGFDAFKTAARTSIGTMVGEILQSPAAIWSKTLPHALFDGILAFNGWKWSDIRPHLREMAIWCADVIFARLSPSELQELAEAKPRMKYGKKGIAGRYIPNEAVERISGTVISLMEAVNYDLNSFKLLLDRQLPVKSPELITKESPRVQPQTLNLFRENLEKAVSTGKFR